jgi:hypothetical protein
MIFKSSFTMLRNAAGKNFQGMKRIQKGRNLPV